MTAEFDFVIQQGATLDQPFYWYAGAPITKAITAITLTAPPVYTATSHGLPTAEIPVELLGIRGPSALNGSVYALKTGTDTFSVATQSASGLSAYIGGGYVKYIAPKDITGYTARMQIRRTLGSATALIELTTGNSRLAVSGAAGKITATLSATETAALNFSTGVYQLELIDGVGVVTRVAAGVVTLSKEVTR